MTMIRANLKTTWHWLKNPRGFATVFAVLGIVGYCVATSSGLFFVVSEQGQFSFGSTNKFNLPINHDRFCGARCVFFILDYYQRLGGLDQLDIVREIQSSELELGAPFKRVVGHLEKHGIFVATSKLNCGGAVVWPHPVILLLPGEPNKLGHYVVLLPNSNRSVARIWDGYDKIQEVQTSELAETNEVVVVLTSPVAIANQSDAFVFGFNAILEDSMIALLLAGGTWWGLVTFVRVNDARRGHRGRTKTKGIVSI